MANDREVSLVHGVGAGHARSLVAIPCFNEELAVASVIHLAKRHADAVLVVDDGSTDRTVEVARAAGAVVLGHDKNEGKGRAVQSAFAYARDHGFDALVLMDGDGQHDPDEIPLLLEPILGREKGLEIDVALGFRHGETTQMPLWRRAGKRVLDYATAAGGAGMVTDSQCGYRAFGRRAIVQMSESLHADGFGTESEQLVQVRQGGLKAENVRVMCRYDGIDGSTLSPVPHALNVMSHIVEVTTMRRPLLTIGLPSVLLLLTAVALGFHTIESYNASHLFSLGFAMATATLAILGTLGIFSALNLNMIILLERRLRAKVGTSR